MKSVFFKVAIIMMLAFSTSLMAQNDYSARLKKETISIQDGKFTVNDYDYLKFPNENTMQIKVSASCPVDVMSRDNFINIYSTVSTMMVLATFSEAGVEIPDIKELDELIGDADITYNIIMAKNGMQIQVTTNEGKENITMKWEEFFEN